MSAPGTSWARWPRARARRHWALRDRDAGLPAGASAPLLAWGQGRSYGDSCLNDGGDLLLARGLDRFIAFDADAGVLEVEAGVTLAEVHALVVPRGWRLPVVPGTARVTVGGAIANDIHGKNHARAGTFGEHVLGLGLVRSDRGALALAAGDPLLRATIGGLGLTGLITRATLRLERCAGPWMREEARRADGLDALFDGLDAMAAQHAHAVAWIDGSARGRALGRGHLLGADPLPADVEPPRGAGAAPGRGLGVPFTPPLGLVNRASARVLNALRFHALPAGGRVRVRHHAAVLHPLDGLRDWHRLHGPAGFLQYQCVLPPPAEREGVALLLDALAHAGLGAFPVVLKRFAERAPAGLLSFPRAGLTLALDLPRTPAAMALLARFDAIVDGAGGALYPAKDARMPPALFRRSHPRLEAFAAFRDPAFSSSLWRRVMA